MRKFIFLFVMTILCVTSGRVSAQKTNTLTYRVGNYEIILLSEGQQKGNPSVLIGATPEILQETIPDGSYPTATNAFLIKTPDKNYLIDTGFGRNLWENLKSAGISAGQIHTVIITHMHGDHIGGLLVDGEKAFPKSQLILSEAEHAYWTSDEEMNKLPENRRGNFLSAQGVVKAYSDQLQLIKPEKLEEKSSDGIYLIEAYGHTPGHVACLLKSGNEQLLVWADLIHVPAVQLLYPQISVVYDVNPEQAAETRKEFLEYAAKHKIPVAGMHLPYPSMGEVQAVSDSGYAFTPVQ
ncbi:MBL fold metallo-hydrolase [termite gut metagenome]|uniref:MBL fold metallo-hydrolase n=1 Tax=termite gut metagenome TaxID=433724 RepID=A0A5J4SRG1_9ZZZZ